MNIMGREKLTTSAILFYDLIWMYKVLQNIRLLQNT